MGPDLAWRLSQGWRGQPPSHPPNTCAGLRVETVPTNSVQEYTGLRPNRGASSYPPIGARSALYSVSNP